MLGAWLLLLGRTITVDVSSSVVFGAGGASNEQCQAIAQSDSAGGRGVTASHRVNAASVAVTAQGDGVAAVAQAAACAPSSITHGIGVVDAVVYAETGDHAAIGDGRVGPSPIFVGPPAQALRGQGRSNVTTISAAVPQGASVGRGLVTGDATVLAAGMTVHGVGRVLDSVLAVAVEHVIAVGRGSAETSGIIVSTTSLARGTSQLLLRPVVQYAGTIAVGTSAALGYPSVNPAPDACMGACHIESRIPLVLAPMSAVAGRGIVQHSLFDSFVASSTATGRGVVVYRPGNQSPSIIVCQMLVTRPVPHAVLAVMPEDVAVIEVSLFPRGVLTVGVVPRSTLSTPAC